MTVQHDSSSTDESEAFYLTYGRESSLPPYLLEEDDVEDARIVAFIIAAMPYLAAEHPGSPYSDEDRAKALRAHELSYVMDDLAYDEEREDALEVGQEVVRLYRHLTGIDPANNRPLLAGALHSLSMRHLELERLGPALRAAEDACAVYRDLAELRPLPFLPDLAGALHHLSARYTDLDCPFEALAPAQESAGIYRRLAEARPERYRLDLTAALENLVHVHGLVGQWADALTTAEEVVELYRRPGEGELEADRADLAGALLNTAWICAHGHLDATRGEPAAREAARLLAGQAEADPVYTAARDAALSLADQLADLLNDQLTVQSVRAPRTGPPA